MRCERILLWVSLTANLLLALALMAFVGKLKLSEVHAASERRKSEELLQLAKEAESTARSPAATKPALADAEQLELARLRNEVTRLRTELRAATNAPAGKPPAARPPASAPPRAEAAPPPAAVRKLTSQTQVNLPLGQTLALGGWPGYQPGERILSFITPTTDPAAPGSVLVQSHLVSVPDRLLDRLGLQDLRTGENASTSAAALDPARFAALLKFAEGETGVSVLSAPRVLTQSGQQAQVSVVQAHADGTQTGPVLNLTPTLDASGANVRLDVNLEMNLPAGPRP